MKWRKFQMHTTPGRKCLQGTGYITTAQPCKADLTNFDLERWLLWSPVMIRNKLSGTHDFDQLRVCHHNIGGPAQKELENCPVLLWPVQLSCVVEFSVRALQLNKLPKGDGKDEILHAHFDGTPFHRLSRWKSLAYPLRQTHEGMPALRTCCKLPNRNCGLGPASNVLSQVQAQLPVTTHNSLFHQAAYLGCACSATC